MENLTEEKILSNQKYNQNLYKIYKMFAWDLLFYYAISFLFLTQEKGLSTSQILFADAFYPLFKVILQLPCTILIEKLGNRKSLIFANLSVFTYILIVMGLTSTIGLIIANFFCAIGYTIKSIAEPNLLYDSIKNSDKKRTQFSKIDGFSSSLYYYFDAITSVTTGFLFVINPYVPMTLCLICLILSTILSYNFKEIPITESSVDYDAENYNPYKNLPFAKQFQFYIRDLKHAFEFIAKSNRLRALIIFNAVFVSLIALIITLRRSVLTELNVPSQYFGIIFAIWGILSGFASNASAAIHKKHRNETLGFLGISYCLSIIFAGLVAVLKGLPPFFVYFSVLCLFTVHSITTGPYYTLIKQYLGSFATSSMRTKILSATILVESITRTVISFIVSYLTDNVSSATATLIIGIVFSLIILRVLSYMKTRVGLKPEEYSESDINFTEIY